MAKIRDLPLANYPTGVYSFVKVLPNGIDGFKVEVGRCTTATPTIWPNVTTGLSIYITPSYDGGNTFDPTAKAGFGDAKGGILVNQKTGEAAVQHVGADFDPPANAVRIDITVTNGPIFTYADITVL